MTLGTVDSAIAVEVVVYRDARNAGVATKPRRARGGLQGNAYDFEEMNEFCQRETCKLCEQTLTICTQ